MVPILRRALDFKQMGSSLSIFVFAFGILAANLISLHVHPFRSYYNELAVVLGLLLALFIQLRCCSEEVAVPRAILFLIAALIVLALQSVFGLAHGQQLIFACIYLGLACLAFVLGAIWGQDPHRFRDAVDLIAFAHLIAALVSVAMQLVQVLKIDARPLVMYMAIDGQSSIRPFANLAQPNQLALLLCFGVASLWWVFQSSKAKNWILALCLAVLLFGLVLTQSRIAWIILPCLGIMATSGWFGTRKIHGLFTFLALGLFGVMTWKLPEISNFMGFTSGSVIERIGGRSERTILGLQALEMIRQHPWFGVGWAGFGPQQVNIGADFPQTIYAEHSHNLVLNIGAEFGLPIAIFFFVLFLVWFGRASLVRAARRRDEVVYVTMFYLAIGVHSMVEFPMWYSFVLLPMALMAGLISVDLSTRVFRISNRYLVGLSLLSLVGCVGVTLDYWRVVDGFGAFRSAKSYEQADPKLIQKPSFTLLPEFYDYFELLQVKPRAGMGSDEIQFVEHGSRRFGFVHILDKLAEVYVLNGEPQKATRTMLTLHRLHPFYYADYYRYWSELAKEDARFRQVFESMPAP